MDIVFTKHEFFKIQRVLGERPGDYHTDPFYLRTGIADKPYFWNADRRKWEMVRLGDVFTLHDDGSVTRTPVEKVGQEAS